MNSQRSWIIISSTAGFLGVALGAFGAHILKSQMSEEMIDIYKTGITYQLAHSVVMLTIAFSGQQKYLKSEIYFITGIILFSFSLYIYSITSIRFFTIITPVGGVFFLLGWISVIFAAVKK